jgi:hypothetical protein
VAVCAPKDSENGPEPERTANSAQRTVGDRRALYRPEARVPAVCLPVCVISYLICLYVFLLRLDRELHLSARIHPSLVWVNLEVFASCRSSHAGSRRELGSVLPGHRPEEQHWPQRCRHAGREASGTLGRCSGGGRAPSHTASLNSPILCPGRRNPRRFPS